MEVGPEEDIVPGKYVVDIAAMIEELSRSENLETTKAAESVLYILKERGLLEG